MYSKGFLFYKTSISTAQEEFDLNEQNQSYSIVQYSIV